LLRELARADEIDVAGPVLRASPVIDEPTLIGIARIKGQEHLLAISGRPQLSPNLTDVIVIRGDRHVVRCVAGNTGAEFSGNGYSGLIKRASDDGILALTVGQRGDLSPTLLQELLSTSTDVVRRRLFEAANPSRKAAIDKAMSEIVGRPDPATAARDFAPAQRAASTLPRAAQLDENALLQFASGYKYEETTAALSAMSGVKFATIDGLMSGERHDPILIISKALGLEWATVRALIMMRLGPNRIPSAADIETARVNFQRLVPSTAQRVMKFWQMRQ
jgi:uncharacterized protein (DUF2336 family)